MAEANTFRAIAAELIDKKKKAGKAPATLKKLHWYLNDLTCPVIGDMPIADIRAKHVLAALKTIEARGHHETAKKTKIAIGQTFRLAMLDDRVQADPTVALGGDALIAAKVTPRAAILTWGGPGQGAMSRK